MSLRSKALLTILVTVGIFLGLLFILSQFILFSGYGEIERASMTRDLARVNNQIERELKSLDFIVYDYGDWDSTYNFLKGDYPDYPQTEWTPSIMHSLNIDVAIITNNDRKTVFKQGMNRTTQQIRPLSAAESVLSDDLILFQQPQVTEATHGLLMIDHQIALVSAKPILTSAQTGPSIGQLIVVRYLSDEIVREISNGVELSVKTFPYNGTMPSYVSDAKAQLTADQSTFIAFINDDSIQGYGLVKDFNGDPILITQVTEERIVLKQGRSTVTLFIGVSVLAGIAVLGALLFWLERNILARLLNLTRQLEGITGDKTIQRIQISGRDELSQVAETINQMLQRLSESRQDVRDAQVVVKDKTQQLQRTQDLLDTTLDQINEAVQRGANSDELAVYIAFARRQLSQLE